MRIKNIQLRHALAATMVVLSSGCSSDKYMNLKGSDDSAQSFNGELRFSVWESQNVNSGAKLRVDIGGGHIDGDFTQRLYASESVSVGGVQLSGPTILSGTVASDETFARLTVGTKNENNFGFNIGFGVKRSQLDIDVSTATQRAQLSHSDSGLNVLFGLRWHPVSTFSAEALYEVTHYNFGVFEVADSVTETQLLGCYLGIERISLCAGYRHWDAQRVVSSDKDSNVKMYLRGPTATVRFNF